MLSNHIQSFSNVGALLLKICTLFYFAPLNQNIAISLLLKSLIKNLYSLAESLDPRNIWVEKKFGEKKVCLRKIFGRPEIR